MGCWEQIPKTKYLHIIPSRWAYWVKQIPSGLVRKLKAGFCICGDIQKEGIDVFETFTPVISWTTVRLLLIISVILESKTKQVDYTTVFCKASMDHDICVALPKGWQALNKMGLSEPFKADHVLHIKKSLYGQWDALRNFFQHRKKSLLAYKFKQNKFDPSLFISHSVICLVYIDDCLLFAKELLSIDSFGILITIRRIGISHELFI